MHVRTEAMTARNTNWTARLVRFIRGVGAYPAIVLMLPGGSLLALSLWMLRHRTWLAARARRGVTAILASCAGLIVPLK
jgi:hypothetical protein